MATYLLNPDDVLVLADTEHKMGGKPACYNFTYSEVLNALRGKEKRHSVKRRPGSAGIRFSRLVSLTASAINKGTWANGARIDRDAVFLKMALSFGELTPSDYEDVTVTAQTTLAQMYHSSHHLSPTQRKALNDICIDISSAGSVSDFIPGGI